NGRENVRDHRGAPEGHLAPGQDVAHEGGGGGEQEDDDAQDPEDFAGGLVGAVEQAAEHMDVESHEEHRGAHRVGGLDDAAAIDVAADMLDRVEGHGHIRRVMHGQDDAGDDLHAQAH